MSEKEMQKDKVGVVTLYHKNYNFGGLLQAYALPKALKDYFGLESEQIDYIFTAQDVETKQDNKKGLFKYLQWQVYNLGIIFFNMISKNNLQHRKQVFDDFINEIPHSESSYNYDSINESLNLYGAFICGGDQIWIDCVKMSWFSSDDSRTFTLQFVPDQVKKISYAPSMAVLDLTDEFKEVFSKGVNRLNLISVREKRALPVLKAMTDKPVTVVVDPVLLLKESDWIKAIKPSQKKGKYILCYLLGDSIEQRRAVNKISKCLGLPIVTFPYIISNAIRKCDLFFGDVRDYTSGPREFVDLIKNADFVITDSFHACVFSMIFKVPFVVFERGVSGEKGNMNSRIYDFLEEYHLEDQLVTEHKLTEMQEIPKIDFDYAHKHWEKRREESLKYLENALKND